MSRSTFGGGIADFVISASSGGALHLAGAALTFWAAKTGGTQYADLLLGADGSGGAAASILVGADGQVPQFQGPDGVTQMWADAGASRVLMTAPGAGGGASNATVAGFVTGSGATKDALTAAFAALPKSVASVSADGALTLGRFNPVSAASGNRAMTLADPATEGIVTWVEKTDSTTNTVVVTGKFRGSSSASAQTIVGQFECMSFISRSDGTWQPAPGHKTKAWFDANFVKLPVSPSDGQLMAWNATSGLWVPVNPSGSSEVVYGENNTGTVTSIPGTGAATDIPSTTIVVPAGTRPVYLSAQCVFKNNSGATGGATARALLLITEVSNGVDTPVTYAGYTGFQGAGATQYLTSSIVPRRLGVPARTRTFKLQAIGTNLAVTVDNGNSASGAAASWISAMAL